MPRMRPIVTVALVFLLIGTLTSAAFADSKGRLEGSWSVSITGGTGTPTLPIWYRALVTFTRDGGLVATITDASISTGHGTWLKVDHRTFAISIVLNQFDGAGGFLGTLRARATLVLNTAADEFTADEYQFEFFDPAGNPTGFLGLGVAHGVRIAAEPSP